MAGLAMGCAGTDLPALPSCGRWQLFLGAGGGEWIPYTPPPRIRIHISLIRGGLEVRRESTANTVLAALRHRSSWSFALIFRLNVQTHPWLPSRLRRAAVLVFMRCQVSGDIHTCMGRSRQSGLLMYPRSSANRRSTPPGVFGGFIGNTFHSPS